MKIALLAGEVSGDKYGALLAAKLKARRPRLDLFGMGGERMAAQGVRIIQGVPYGVMGLSGVLSRLPSFVAGFRRVLADIARENPALVVLLDNPGFNLRVAARIGTRFPCYYYIPPKVWAHGYGRIHVMKSVLKGVIAIFPFEKELYDREGIPCVWFGHPIGDIMEFTPEREPFWTGCGLDTRVPLVGVFPGSRREEIGYLMPLLLRAVEKIGGLTRVQAVFSAVDGAARRQQEWFMRRQGVSYPIWEGSPYGLMKYSAAVFAACGTANLEVALLKTPLLVFYRTSSLTYGIARHVVQLSHVSPANIPLGKDAAVPEYIQSFSLGDACDRALELLEKGPLYRREMAAFMRLEEMLRRDSVTDRVAEFLLGRTGETDSTT